MEREAVRHYGTISYPSIPPDIGPESRVFEMVRDERNDKITNGLTILEIVNAKAQENFNMHEKRLDRPEAEMLEQSPQMERLLALYPEYVPDEDALYSLETLREAADDDNLLVYQKREMDTQIALLEDAMSQ